MVFRIPRRTGLNQQLDAIQRKINEITDKNKISSLQASDVVTNNNDSSFVDTDLSATLEANSFYRVEIYIIFDTSAVADMRTRMTKTSGLSGAVLNMTITYAASTGNDKDFDATQNHTGNGVGDIRLAQYQGMVKTTAEGVMTLQFRQNTAEATDTTIHANSYMVLTKLG